MTSKKNILLCVTGGIAVYKAVALTSKLTQAGFTVKVMMTQSAMQFVNPLSFQVMSKNDVFYDTFDEKDSAVIAHIDLADWADLIIVAPATANVIGKLANGIADNMVTTTLLAATAPIWLAPAMNVHMYDHPAVKRNIAQLHQDGYAFIEPAEGFLACGYVGKGRLEEPEKITAIAQQYFVETASAITALPIIVTTGNIATFTVDGNYISAQQQVQVGQQVALQLAKRGAQVTLVTAEPVAPQHKNMTVVQVANNNEMATAVTGFAEKYNKAIVIDAANYAKGYEANYETALPLIKLRYLATEVVAFYHGEQILNTTLPEIAVAVADYCVQQVGDWQ